MAWSVWVVSDHGMVVAGVIEALASCLQGKGRSILPSPSKVMWKSTMCLTMGWAHDSGAWTIPNGREAQATEVVDDELEALKADGFTEGENIIRQALTIRSDGEHWWGNHQNV
jgi:hypothetical protein